MLMIRSRVLAGLMVFALVSVLGAAVASADTTIGQIFIVPAGNDLVGPCGTPTVSRCQGAYIDIIASNFVAGGNTITLEFKGLSQTLSGTSFQYLMGGAGNSTNLAGL